MKKNKISFINTCLSIVLFGVTALIINSCGSKDDPSVKDVTTKQLTSSGWKVKSVKVDDTDHTAMFTGFTLTFTPTTYTTTHGGEVWPASGNWVFADATAKKITRSDDVEVTIDAISESELVLSLKWETTTYSAGRTNSISGVHKFTLSK